MQASSYSNLQTEPAFVSNERYCKSRQQSGAHKSLSDCCYSAANLALIVASVIAIVFLVKFIQDDLLYDYGEHILGLQFYRQLIYIIVVVPLTLLVPMFNAASVFFLYGKDKSQLGSSLTKAKLLYSIIMAILIFIALVFIAPSIRHTNLVFQIDTEFRRHMKMRYENPFSYEFLDRVQEQFQCCDELWYRANYLDKIPTSCYVPNGLFENMFPQTCPDVIGSIVSDWCSMIAASLVAILICLATLMGMDVLALMAYSSGQYNIAAHEARVHGSSSSLNEPPPGSMRSASPTKRSAGPRRSSSQDKEDDDDHDSDHDDDDDILSGQVARKLMMGERERERQRERLAAAPLLDHREHAPGNRPPALRCPEGGASPLPTRAAYLHNRPQSPVFLQEAPTANRYSSNTSLGGQSSHTLDSQGRPMRSALKKTPSSSRVDNSSNDAISMATNDDEDALSLHEQQRQLQRELQSRRSLLNVRFAD